MLRLAENELAYLEKIHAVNMRESILFTDRASNPYLIVLHRFGLVMIYNQGSKYVSVELSQEGYNFFHFLRKLEGLAVGILSKS